MSIVSKRLASLSKQSNLLSCLVFKIICERQRHWVKENFCTLQSHAADSLACLIIIIRIIIIFIFLFLSFFVSVCVFVVVAVLVKHFLLMILDFRKCTARIFFYPEKSFRNYFMPE